MEVKVYGMLPEWAVPRECALTGKWKVITTDMPDLTFMEGTLRDEMYFEVAITESYYVSWKVDSGLWWDVFGWFDDYEGEMRTRTKMYFISEHNIFYKIIHDVQECSNGK